MIQGQIDRVGGRQRAAGAREETEAHREKKE